MSELENCQNKIDSIMHELYDFKMLFEHSSDGVLIIKDNKFILCNEKIVTMLGYKDKDELLHLHPSKLSPEFQPDGSSSFEKAEEMMNVAFKNGWHQFEWKHKKANGEDFWVEVTLRPIVLKDYTSIHVIWKDISVLKEIQRQLIEKEKMSALGSLVAGVAHEINTPLGVSITGISLINSENKIIIDDVKNNKLGKDTLTEFLEMIDTVSNSMTVSLTSAANLVSSFKQVAIDQYTESKRSFNLKSYLDEVLLGLHSKLKYSTASVVNEVDVDIVMYSYAGIFSQILTNFIMNSLLHGFEDEDVDNEIIIKAWINSEHLYLSYEDNGKGIEEKHIGKVFEPFFTTKFGSGGSGLGLNIIYNLINHKLNGNITCTNKKEGILMSIIIPLEELQEK